MDDYALVLNAGSSSLKFCMYQRPSGADWRIEARGQIEGIGTSPRLSIKDAAGKSLAKQEVTAARGREAVEVLGAWLKSTYRQARVVGVGHRVVHGGEEFLLLLPGCDLATGVRHAERLRALVAEEPFDTPEGRHSITCSLGVASTSCDTPKDADSLIRAADAALYQAKHKGRNRVETP